MNTLQLDDSGWDLVIDAYGNIAMRTGGIAIAQDAASACKTWLGEVYYNTTLGVPYPQILAHLPPASFVKSKLAAAAETVPGVASATVYLTSYSNRELGGQVQITTSDGAVEAANF